jgi:hypothetical protein
MGFIEQYIARIVTFVVAPLAVSAATAVAYAAQKYVGIDFDANELSVYLTSVAVGQALVIYKWLSGRAQYEIATATGYVKNLNEIGQANTPVDVPAKIGG